MNPRQKRQIQFVLAALLLGLAVAVGLTLRSPQEAPAPPEASLAPGQPDLTRTGDLAYRIFRDGKESLVLHAKGMEGSEKEELRFTQVTLTFGYMASGEPGRGTINADECRYSPAQQKAAFRGHVVVQTSDTFELRTDALNYRADRGVARSDKPVTFKRKDMSGSATGFIYHAESGTVELQEDVVVRLRDPDQVPGEIKSRRALLEKDKGSLEFQGSVRAVQGADTLSAETYYVEFVKQTRAFRRATAYGDAVLTLRGAGGGLAGPAPATLRQSGPRVLRAPKLDLWFRPDRSLEEVSAGPGAELRLQPGPNEPQGPRTLRARVLVFRMDSQGRVTEVQGQKDSSFLSEAPKGSSTPPLEGACRSFLARLDPQSGEVREIQFLRDVAFQRGTQRATGGRGRFDAEGLLRLVRKPELVDSARRMRLSAATLEMQTRTGDLAAQGGVRHVVEAQSPAAGGGGLLAPGGGTTLVVAQEFAHDQAQRSTRYSGEALMRLGSDEVRAGRITVVERPDGKRMLTAEEGVVSRFQAQPGRAAAAGGEAKPAAPIEVRAKVMVYDEGQGKIAYRQDVVLRQERLVTRSPRADLTLTPDGRGLASLTAGEPVEMVEGQRKVVGQRATYTPQDEKVVVEGERVVLTGPGQEAQGRTLTLHVGDDRILVDGREESRTETVFRKEPRKP
jgi:LPS export ABC transporter protein LptC